MPGTMIEIPCHLAPISAYLSGSTDSTKAVIIFHEWWGLKHHNRAIADHFAKLGYLAIIPDLYDGRLTNSTEEAGEWMRELDSEESNVDLRIHATLRYISDGGKRKVATYGCSMGGRHSLMASLVEPNLVQATVLGYCRMEKSSSKLEPLQAPVLVVYAQQESTWPAKQQQFEKIMQQLGKPCSAVVYDAAHGFTNPDSSRYDAEADADHLLQVEKFLAKHL